VDPIQKLVSVYNRFATLSEISEAAVPVTGHFFCPVRPGFGADVWMDLDIQKPTDSARVAQLIVYDPKRPTTQSAHGKPLFRIYACIQVGFDPGIAYDSPSLHDRLNSSERYWQKLFADVISCLQ
jgi:hypothetical protein